MSLRIVGAILASIVALATAEQAHAGLAVHIDKSTQQMRVSVDGVTQHVWKVSTGSAGYGTPNGHFRPQRLERQWFSRKYYNSPMPHSVFFHHGFAIHGTNYISRLGGPASHGCVRLHPANAAALFALVRSHGMANTSIVVGGSDGEQIAKQRQRVKSARARVRDHGGYVEQPLYGEPVYERPVRYAAPPYSY